MYLIDETYFTENLYMPNIKEVNSREAERLNKGIEKYVPLFLQQVLGFSNFEDFNSNIVDGVLENTAPQKWLDLVNGKTYSDSKWVGLLDRNANLLANFVYYNLYQNTYNTTIGQVEVNPKNGLLVNPGEHLSNVWNNFVQAYQGCTNEYYPYYLSDLYKNDYISLVEFLDREKSTYNIEVKFLEFKNRLGI